jgi:hypothetical protein
LGDLQVAVFCFTTLGGLLYSVLVVHSGAWSPRVRGRSVLALRNGASWVVLHGDAGSGPSVLPIRGLLFMLIRLHHNTTTLMLHARSRRVFPPECASVISALFRALDHFTRLALLLPYLEYFNSLRVLRGVVPPDLDKHGVLELLPVLLPLVLEAALDVLLIRMNTAP